MMNNSTKVFLRQEKSHVEVKITDRDKPVLSGRVVSNWQKIINMVARIMDVPAGLIMEITPESMKVFLSSETKSNPYKPEASDQLGHGLYCETVIGRNATLEVENALVKNEWKDNPDVKLNMISYLGMPLKWPDGEFFGTICVLDNKERKFNDDYHDLLSEIKHLIEMDLEKELKDLDISKSRTINELRIKELHHRIKNEFNVISALIQLKASETESDQQQILCDIDSKLRTAAVLHSKIYDSTDMHSSITEYIRDVIKTSAGVYDSNISITVNASAEMDFPSRYMLDFGLVFSELVTNSIKYGLPHDNGAISVDINSVVEDGKERYVIVYKDNGPGFSQDVLNGQGREGVGTLMIDLFLSRFDGFVKKYNSDGAVTEFNISNDNPEGR